MTIKDWISLVCTVITTMMAVIVSVVTIADKKKTAKRVKPRKHHVKRR